MTSAATRRLALVTGGSRGIGRAIAESLLAAGFDVVTASRSGTGPAGAANISCDLADRAALDALAAEVAQRAAAGLDVCVLNAALRRFAPVAVLDDHDWDVSADVNLTASVLLAGRLLPLVRQARGHVIIVGSHAATRFFEGGVAYSATKAGLKALAETLLLEERPHGVRTALLSLGAVRNRPEDQSAEKVAPESVAELVRWLVTGAPADMAFGEIEVRPAVLGPRPVEGLARLQHV